MADVPLGCECGAIEGVARDVGPRSGTRVVCYCADCQAFARFLDRPGITDEHGGTDIFQMAPGRVQITKGGERLACVRLSEKGMHRWYCSACTTPIGNTMGPRLPFVGLIHSFMPQTSGRSRNDALGPPLGYFSPTSAIGALPRDARGSVARVMLRSVRLLGTWWLTDAGRPSPFFDATGKPKAEVRVLTPSERAAL